MKTTLNLAPTLVRAMHPYALLLLEAGLSREDAVDLAAAIFSGGIAYAVEVERQTA